MGLILMAYPIKALIRRGMRVPAMVSMSLPVLCILQLVTSKFEELWKEEGKEQVSYEKYPIILKKLVKSLYIFNNITKKNYIKKDE